MSSIRAAALFLILLVPGCQSDTGDRPVRSEKSPPTATLALLPAASPTPEPSPEEAYPGVELSGRFPAVASAGTTESLKDGKHQINVGQFKIEFVRYTPVSITGTEGKSVRIETQHPGEYNGYAVGFAELRGKQEDTIYIEIGGPGAVCCSQILLFDVSGRYPKFAFTSEDYGRFKWGAEIFDSEGDGTLEIAMFDSCFRYFMDDCGSCSPQPRAVFKYDKRNRKYIPAKGLQQDFAKEALKETKAWIKEQYALKDEERDFRYRWSVNQFVVQQLWLGDEEKAWSFFDQFALDRKQETKKEMKETLKECKYYQAIRKLP